MLAFLKKGGRVDWLIDYDTCCDDFYRGSCYPGGREIRRLSSNARSQGAAAGRSSRVRIVYSSLNYKDGLAVTLKPGVTRKYPMVPGIDFAGVVEESSTPEFEPGAEVVVTGCGTAETLWGGYAQYARIDAEYIVPLPPGMTLKQAMGIGTGRIHGHAERAGAGAAWAAEGRTAGAGDGGCGGRRQRCGGDSRESGVPGGRVHGTSGATRLSARLGR